MRWFYCCIPALLSATTIVAAERITMDETAVIGNQELPKVLYIVPWKKSELPGLNKPPLDALIDDALQPLDRNVLKRQIEYYEALK